jgi:lysophospholipase L1-like esterase
MAIWVLDQWDEAIDYATLGFIARPHDLLSATAKPDGRWSLNSNQSAAETVQRYAIGGDPSYVEPGDGNVLTWSDVNNAYVPTNATQFVGRSDVAAALSASPRRLDRCLHRDQSGRQRCRHRLHRNDHRRPRRHQDSDCRNPPRCELPDQRRDDSGGELTMGLLDAPTLSKAAIQAQYRRPHGNVVAYIDDSTGVGGNTPVTPDIDFGDGTRAPTSTGYVGVNPVLNNAGTIQRGESPLSYAVLLAGGRAVYGINASVAGETAAQYATRVAADVLPRNPQVLVFGSGINDIGGSTPATLAASFTAYKAAIKSIVLLCRQNGITPILHTTLPTNNTLPSGTVANRRDAISKFNAWLTRYALQERITLLDYYVALMDPAAADGSFLAAYVGADGTHPTAAGYFVLGTLLANALKAILPDRAPMLCQFNTDGNNMLTNSLFLNATAGLPTSWSQYNQALSGTYAISNGTDAALPGAGTADTAAPAKRPLRPHDPALLERARGAFCYPRGPRRAARPQPPDVGLRHHAPDLRRALDAVRSDLHPRSRRPPPPRAVRHLPAAGHAAVGLGLHHARARAADGDRLPVRLARRVRLRAVLRRRHLVPVGMRHRGLDPDDPRHLIPRAGSAVVRHHRLHRLDEVPDPAGATPMNYLPVVVSIVFPILTIIVGGFCVLQLGVTKTLRDSNGDLRARVTDLEASDQRKDEKIKGQAAEIAALQRVVTGEVQLAAIADVLQHHHEQAVHFWDNANRVLVHTDETLAELATHLRETP